MARSGRGRSLTNQERQLWSKIAETATPLDKAHPPKIGAQPVRPKAELAKPVKSSVPIPEFRIGDKAGPSRTLPESARPAPVRMDQKTFGRLKRGRLSPEARIDLHGMTQAAAHPALIGFILRAQADGKRLVLVITGKGRVREEDQGPIPTRPGVLRRQVPHWLETPPLAQLVLQVQHAHQKHGGSGAFYVYLRRR